VKQIIQDYRTGKIELKEVPISVCHAGGVLVETKFSLISAGTEKLMIDLARKSLISKARARPDLVKKVFHTVKEQGVIATAKKVFARLDEPVALGYSCSGEVISVGENVTEFEKADRVACAGAGFASHAEVNFVPKNLCVKVPQSVSLDQACFTTVGAIAMQGIRRCRLNPGESVAVIGLGLIGQLTVQILSAYGFCVLGLDIDRTKVDGAVGLGLTEAAVIGEDDVELAAQSLSDGYGVDAVIITASTASNEPVELAGRICRRAGRVTAVGLVGMEIPRQIYYEKELDFRISCSYGPGRYDINYEQKGLDYPYSYVRWTEKRNMSEFLRLISVGKVNVKQMITHRFNLEDYERAYNLITSNPGGEAYTGILFEYDSAVRCEPVVVFDEAAKKRRPQGSVNAAVIGAGNFANSITLPNLKRLEKVNICAIADVNSRTAEKVGRKYKCRYCTADYNEVLDDEEIDTVFITTRHNLHAPIITEALKKEKNVFVEKPLCIKEQQLKQIITAYQTVSANGRPPVLMVGFNRRFALEVIRLKKRLSNRSTPLMINYRINAGNIAADHWVHDEQGGGRIIGEVCHFVDLLGFLTDSAAVKVYAACLSPEGNILTDDNVSIVIDFADGSKGTIVYTAMGDKTVGKEYIEIFGDRKTFVIDDFKRGLFGLNHDKGHFNELKLFTEAVASGGAGPIPVDEIFTSTLATFKIKESLKTGEPVRIDLSQVVQG